jgi:hypothetical protein
VTLAFSCIAIAEYNGAYTDTVLAYVGLGEGGPRPQTGDKSESENSALDGGRSLPD